MINNWVQVVPDEGHHLFIIAVTSRYDELSNMPGALEKKLKNRKERRMNKERIKEKEGTKEEEEKKSDSGDKEEEEEIGKGKEKYDITLGLREGTVISSFQRMIGIPSLRRKNEISKVLKETNKNWPEGKADEIGEKLLYLVDDGIPIKILLNTHEDAVLVDKENSWKVFVDCFMNYIEVKEISRRY